LVKVGIAFVDDSIFKVSRMIDGLSPSLTLPRWERGLAGVLDSGTHFRRERGLAGELGSGPLSHRGRVREGAVQQSSIFPKTQKPKNPKTQKPNNSSPTHPKNLRNPLCPILASPAALGYLSEMIGLAKVLHKCNHTKKMVDNPSLYC